MLLSLHPWCLERYFAGSPMSRGTGTGVYAEVDMIVIHLGIPIGWRKG